MEDHNVAMMMMIHSLHAETQHSGASDCSSENCKTHLPHCNPNSENTGFPEVVSLSVAEEEDSD